ncbi:uncharacterized protein CEXT_570991 [Caerostris extrusa]|uniref:Uncharacterized protein n=1 Tax=Caerostris extrusa TaxID=172846 RepID=A0AAV4VU68_CAEEX|nr:uncharacterized protein CEXT_570991 [Caerostris extrusa]
MFFSSPVSYTTDDLIFDWESKVPLVVEPTIELPQHILVDTKLGDCMQAYSTGVIKLADFMQAYKLDTEYTVLPVNNFFYTEYTVLPVNNFYMEYIALPVELTIKFPQVILAVIKLETAYKKYLFHK